IERIEAQLRDRIEEAVEMAALKLMVDARAQAERPAPESTSATDRTEFEASSRALLLRLRERLLADRTGLPGPPPAGLLAALRAVPAGRRPGSPGSRPQARLDPPALRPEPGLGRPQLSHRLGRLTPETGHGPEVLALVQGPHPFRVGLLERGAQDREAFLGPLDVGPQVRPEAGGGALPGADGDAIDQSVQIILQQPVEVAHPSTSCGTRILNT